jgi:hypothetical protein
MIAIYIPVLPSTEKVHTHSPKANTLNHKTAFMLRALHAYNESKYNQITCLGTAVTYHRRCRYPLRTTKLAAILAEMAEAAEDPYALLGDLRFLAVEWARGLSCYLHEAQKGVVMAALGAVAVYRLECEVVAVYGGLPGVWKYELGLVHCMEGEGSLEVEEEAAKGLAENVGESDDVVEGLLETPKCPEEKPDESDAMSEALPKAAKSPAKSSAKNADKSNNVPEGIINEGTIKQWEKLHGLEMALLSLAEAVLKLCASIVWLYLSALLVYASILLLLGKK